MKWEYKTLRIFKQKEFDEFDGAQGGELAKLGSEGWELVSVDNGIAYFKRPIVEKEPSYFTPEYFAKLNSGNEIPTKRAHDD